MVWLWKESKFEPVEVDTKVNKVMAAVGLAESNGQAHRLVKQGAVSFRVEDGTGEWTKVKEPFEPIESVVPKGWPMLLRAGKTMVTVMLPTEGQTIEGWTSIWNEG